MKNVILLVPTLETGGQERVAVNTADVLSDTYNVTFVVFDSRNKSYSPRCGVVSLNVPASSNRLMKAVNVLRRARALRKIKKQTGCDCCYSFGTTANYANCLAGGPGKRIVSLHGYRVATFGRAAQFLYRRSDLIICVSGMIKSVVDSNYPFLKDKTSVLYNPYDFDAMYRMASDSVDDCEFEVPTVISHGRLQPVKNYQCLIKAFGLASAGRACKLVIIGEGDERPYLESLIVKYGLEDKASLIGYRDNPFKYLARASVYVLSSFNEGFPNSLIEGMAFLPVIATDCKSGPREILSDRGDEKIEGVTISDHGVLIEDVRVRDRDQQINADDETLAAAIGMLLDDGALAAEMRKKAKERAGVFSYDLYKKELAERLERL